ncbi:WD repeat-containing protein 81 [Mortierella sp. GBA30]|nr:WD repeat-containing protein 81 [Mortierella sp. GBA30]
MFGAGLDAQELTALIERDLHLQVAFPCFPLESTLGHTACCVAQKSWLDQLHKGIATNLYENKSTKDGSTNTGTSRSAAGEVNVFINVISKIKPLKQENWTRARVFTQSGNGVLSKPSRPLQKSFTTLTAVPTNSDWNLTGEAYIRELMSVSGDDVSRAVDPATDVQLDYSAFVPVLEGEDSEEGDRDALANGDGKLTARNRNRELVDHVLDTIYPTTLRYRVVFPSQDDGRSNPRLVLMDRDPKSNARPVPANIASATVIIESDDAHYCISPHRSGGATGLTTLQDLLRFNPGNLNTSLKKGFLVYQLLKAVKGLHDNGIVHGNLKSSNIYIDENLWISLTGIKCSVPYSGTTAGPQSSDLHMQRLGDILPKEPQAESTVMRWAKGEISNFTYLMVLNHAAGRRLGDPNVHPIFPWIMDFTGSEVHHGWRDFSKTKFRLNKGDEQLDVTFDGPIPHHITDILSDITYYVYMARQISIPVLCQFVRSKYEANEYPSSIQRLYEWTPDECIPEFYTDPSIFRSIHADMPDMALPRWAKTPEDFIRIHREALESDYVSRHLHEWIDLTFGYKLSGQGAIDAKNVALSLFPGQGASMKHGIIQLFTDPHPQRANNWSLSKVDFLESQAKALTSLERASKITKRRSIYRLQNERPQFVEKVSDLLFRPAAPTRSKSLRQQSGSRPASVVISATNERDPAGSYQTGLSQSTNALLSPINSTAQDTNLALASTRPEALVQLIQSEPIEFSRDMHEASFIEELDHFEKTFHFGSKYHFLNSKEAHARIISDSPALEENKTKARLEESFEYMQSWDVYCLGDVFKQIYLAEDIPNNSIAMALMPQMSAPDLNQSRLIPIAVRGTIASMLNDGWRHRPKIGDILRKSIPALSRQSPTISMFVPTAVTEIYEFLSMFYVCPECTQMDLANKWIDRICKFEDETFEIALPVFVHLFTNGATRVNALGLFPNLGQRLGIKRTKAFLLKPIVALFEASRPVLPKELFKAAIFSEFLRRFGASTFLQQIFPFYLESLVADYSQSDVASDDNSSASSSATVDNGISVATSTSLGEGESFKKSMQDGIPKLGKIAGEAFVGICRSLGPILTSKHVMKPFSRLSFKEPISLPLLKGTLSGIAHEFGSTFALVQFSHIMHLIDSASSTFTTRASNSLRNLLGMLGALVPHMYDTQLVTELKNGGSELIYRLIEPSPRKTSGRAEVQANTRLAISRNTMDFILQLSFSLSRPDWEKHIAPILQKYFSGFGPETDEMSTKTASALDIQRNEQVGLASNTCHVQLY